MIHDFESISKKYFGGAGMRYNSASRALKLKFGERVQKISIDAGFTCPNRDGTKAFGGCTYCNNTGFSPFYCTPKKSIEQQLREGMDFFGKKYEAQKYIAYFQSYTNTYAPFEILREMWETALQVPDVIGLAISTRPDCMDDQVLDYLQKLSANHFISVEYGLESCYDKTLQLINRAHCFADSADVLQRTALRGLHTVVHIILGLPGESRDEIINQAQILSELPFDTLKLHQLQILKNTVMQQQFEENPNFFQLYDVDAYIELTADFVTKLKPQIKIERFTGESPPDLVVAPKWGGLKNFEITAKIEKYLHEKNLFQGMNYLQQINKSR